MGPTALAIMPSHQQNMHVFADGRKDMNDIFNNYVCSASHMHPGLHFQNVWREPWPTWVQLVPDGPHVGPMNLAIGAALVYIWLYFQVRCRLCLQARPVRTATSWQVCWVCVVTYTCCWPRTPCSVRPTKRMLKHCIKTMLPYWRAAGKKSRNLVIALKCCSFNIVA